MNREIVNNVGKNCTRKTWVVRKIVHKGKLKNSFYFGRQKHCFKRQWTISSAYTFYRKKTPAVSTIAFHGSVTCFFFLRFHKFFRRLYVFFSHHMTTSFNGFDWVNVSYDIDESSRLPCVIKYCLLAWLCLQIKFPRIKMQQNFTWTYERESCPLFKSV